MVLIYLVCLMLEVGGWAMLPFVSLRTRSRSSEGPSLEVGNVDCIT
jgi:hypothetical protein